MGRRCVCRGDVGFRLSDAGEDGPPAGPTVQPVEERAPVYGTGLQRRRHDAGPSCISDLDGRDAAGFVGLLSSAVSGPMSHWRMRLALPVQARRGCACVTRRTKGGIGDESRIGWASRLPKAAGSSGTKRRCTVGRTRRRLSAAVVRLLIESRHLTCRRCRVGCDLALWPLLWPLQRLSCQLCLQKSRVMAGAPVMVRLSRYHGVGRWSSV